MKPLLRRKIALALASLALLMALSAGLGLITHDTLREDIATVADAERDTHAALVLSLTARDLYAHQAHTIILNDRSHLDHYGATEREARVLVDALRGFIGDGELRPAVEELAREIDALRDHFADEILPNVGGPRAALVPIHDRALDHVDRITAVTDRLTTELRHRALEARARADAAASREATTLILFALFAGAFALALGISLARALTRPLGKLLNGAERLARGELDTRIELERDDELGALARAFNRMAAELALREERLVAAERLASLGQLAAGVAHEVNNPLTAIIGHARLIERDAAASGEAREGAALVLAEAERCRAIVSGLLDLARPPRLTRVALDLAEVADEVAQAIARGHGDAVAAHALFHIQRPAAGVTLSGDAPKLRQVVWNLLKNAVEAAPEGPVRVSFAGDPARVVMRVSDPGAGIPEAVRARLFEPFVTSKPDGTGLGLAVSLALARAHGGTLRLVSTGAGAGTTFELELPRGEGR